jgi:large subunit ribosomal protein L21
MKYAIVESGGKQFKAVEGATIEVDRMPVEVGAALKLEQVLLLVDGDSVTVGTPVVKDTPVWTKVVEHFKGPKVVIFNYRPKKRIRVKTGHRQNYTRLMVEQIGGATLLVKKEPEKAVALETEKPAKAEKPAKREAKPEKKAEPAAKSKAAPAKEKKPAAVVSKSKAAPAKPAAKAKTPAKKPAAPKTTTKKPSEKSSAKK